MFGQVTHVEPLFVVQRRVDGSGHPPYDRPHVSDVGWKTRTAIFHAFWARPGRYRRPCTWMASAIHPTFRQMFHVERHPAAAALGRMSLDIISPNGLT